MGKPDAGRDVVSPARVAVVRGLKVEVEAGWDIVLLARRALMRVTVVWGIEVEVDARGEPGRDYRRAVVLLSGPIPSGGWRWCAM